MLKAVVFDFDGVIVDSEPFHYRAFQEVLRPFGISFSWDEYVSIYMGFDDRDAFTEAFKPESRQLSSHELQQLIEKKAAVFPDIIAGTAVPYPGVVELIQELAAIMPLALCSGALRSDLEPILKQLSLYDRFSVIVSAEDVPASKPDPASYQLAVKRLSERFPHLSIDSSECIAIEDTPAGITSAHGAGLKVVAVSNSYEPARLCDAETVVSSLSLLTLEQMRAL